MPGKRFGIKQFYIKALPWIVWTLRIALGAVFLVSGLSKGIDLWGFVYKIEEYLSVWDFVQPRSLVVVAAMGISCYEFTFGAMLLVGCYRRFSASALLAMMAVMLPLTLYIYVANPVADCGCFGDFLIISNAATFWKNVVITAGLIYLLTVTRKVDGLYRFFTQWATTTVSVIYFLTVAMLGYNVQPLLDFRSFPVGTRLIDDEDSAEETNEYKFVYSKDGVEKEFDLDNLPDSTWSFVDRRLVGGSEMERTDFVVMDGEENVSEDIIAEQGEQLVVVVPQGERADVSYTYTINELWRYITARGGSLVELVAMPEAVLPQWMDLSMATYPVYSADGTMLKEMSRGDISAIYLRDGVIQWKRSLASIDVDMFARAGEGLNALELLDTHGHATFLWLSSGYLALMLLLWGMSKSRSLFLLRQRLRKKLKS